MKKISAQLPYLVRSFFLIRKAAPGLTLIWIALLFVQGLLPVAIVYLTRTVVDRLVEALGSGGDWVHVRPLLVPAVAFAAVFVLITVVQGVLDLVRSVQSQRVQDWISALIQEKSTALDLVFYESSEYYDQLYRARNDAASRPLELIESLGGLLRNGITLTAMAAVLVPYSVWAPAALIVSTLPTLYIVLDHHLRQYRWRISNTENERRAWYYDWLLTGRENAAEMRAFELGHYFMSAFQRLRETLRDESIHLERSRVMAESGAVLIALLMTGIVMGWMAWRAVAGTATMGDLALFYQAFNQGQSLMRSLLKDVGRMYGNSLFLSDFFDFLALEPQINDPPEPADVPTRIEQNIRFDDVVFRYPGAGHRALDHFNLDLQAGSISAIVGANGSGKTTLVKLLCRFYDPESGAVLLDGINIRKFRVNELRRMMTVLFQEPVCYNDTAAVNIRYGDLAVDENAKAIVTAARAAGADGPISRLDAQYQTRLGRWFAGSIDLSGGEWQRIALARAFLRRSPIIILDEPTSAMDSWSEMDWLGRFRQLAAGRTAIIITHRFTTAMQADIIHVMDQGRVVESGRHKDLLARDGLYALSWRKQMRAGN